MPCHQQADALSYLWYQGENHLVQLRHLTLSDPAVGGRVQMNVLFAGDLRCGFAHALREFKLCTGLLPAQIAHRLIAAFLLPIQQDLCLISLLAVAGSSCLSFLLALALFAHRLLLAPPIESGTFQFGQRILLRLCLSLRIEGVVAAVAT